MIKAAGRQAFPIVDYPAYAEEIAPAWSRGWDDGPSWEGDTDEFPVIVLPKIRYVGPRLTRSVWLTLWMALIIMFTVAVGGGLIAGVIGFFG